MLNRFYKIVKDMGGIFLKPFWAVHESDLEQMLKHLGADDAIKNKREKCCFCHSFVTFDNIFAIVRKGNKNRFCCDKPDCVAKLAGGDDHK